MNTITSNYLLELITEVITEMNNDSSIDLTTANYYGEMLEHVQSEIIDNTDYSL